MGYANPVQGGKKNGQILASPAARPDLRRDITAWKALVWAYRDEAVRAATNASNGSYANTGLARATLERDRVSSGVIGGFLEAHADALVIDCFVNECYKSFKGGRDGVARAAEHMRPVPPASVLPRLRFLPILKADGSVRCEYARHGRHDEPYLCLLTVDGYSDDEIQRHHEFHALFLALLDAMPGLKLTRWKIAGRGC